MRGESHERRVGALVGRVKKNMNFLTQDDLSILEFMANKGDFPDKEIKLIPKVEYTVTRRVTSSSFSFPEWVPFVNEVEEFNSTFGKPNNYEPTIPDQKEWKFVYDFILEELEEYREACESGNIVEVLDALCDITYVSLGNGVMLHGLKNKIWPAYQEVQASNMSKSCETEEEALETISLRSKEQGEACHYEKVGGRFVVYRTRDKKVMKSINYFKPDLSQFFTEKELQKSYLKQITGLND
jgi:predicted HAD superfamily Cof-like phosphohydrolase